jgi:hypothetical protein
VSETANEKMKQCGLAAAQCGEPMAHRIDQERSFRRLRLSKFEAQPLIQLVSNLR